MSVRSCLLCGRALSRWNGAGDDFCSREHRNQYRLRRSMDRLQEANQVATVMRRRESTSIERVLWTAWATSSTNASSASRSAQTAH